MTHDIFIFLSFGPSIINPSGTKFHQNLLNTCMIVLSVRNVKVIMSFWHLKVRLRILIHHYNNYSDAKNIIQIFLCDMAFLKCLFCQKFAHIQYVLAVTWFPLDCLEHILPLIFFRCSNAPNAMNLFELLSCSFDITNMRILDTAKDIYERLLKKWNVSALTLRPILYFDAHFQE